MSLSNSNLDALRIERHPERSSGVKPWMIVVVAVLLLGSAAVYWWHSRADPVAVQTVVAQDAMAGGGDGEDHSVLNASGYVTARREATVSSKVTGKVISILIEEGMKVTNGQILARLDDSNVRAALEVAKAQLLSAQAAVEETRAQLKQANADYERVSELAQRKISSQSDLDQAEASAKSLRAHLEWQETQIAIARSQVDMSQQDLDDMTIRAPFDGVVTTKDAQPGEMISPVSAGGGYTRTGIGTVVDMKSLEIDIDVNENYINRVEPGQAVVATLDAYPDWKIPCKVIAIVPTADRDKSTVKVRVGFIQLDPRILPDMSVKVSFQNDNETSSRRAVLIPKNAIIEQDGRDIVFVVQDGRAERRAVTVSDTQDDNSILSAGVSPGEKVVATPPADLKDGMAVREEHL
ncbi:MAG TPA: efflux RND transporter periplasmic adaptor subunit [Alphaproteobacteria bacterium]|nr:efflux RND transporter periplasmic adaptor subunit [Alphaproteobacteria bacterium]